jgi:hypothetical protein
MVNSTIGPWMKKKKEKWRIFVGSETHGWERCDLIS